jgi:hypothetical protein
MIADPEGAVRWQHPRNICSTTQLDELTEIRGFGQKEAKLHTKDLQYRANSTTVMLEGREYRLFSQPLAMKLSDGTTRAWVIAGVVSNARFAADSVTVSYTVLVLFLAVFLLVIFSLPFLKLRLLGELQRVRVTDIITLGIALLCAIAVVTLICLDAFAYRNTRSAADEQLRHLGSDIKRHVNTEIRQAYGALDALDRALPDQAVVPSPIPANARALAAVKAYPFFEIFSRVDANGEQLFKWHMDPAPIPPINVKDRNYFRDVLRDQEWALNEDGTKRYALEAVRSRTTGQTQAVIAKKATGDPAKGVVVTLAFPMLSLIDTVVAGDCKFVVIDDDGRVVFHSESQRNNVENFFIETDKDRTLRAAVAGRQNEMVNIRYWGEDQRAFVTPVGGTPWTLVTFRSKRLLRTLNVETIMIAVMFLLIHALGYAMFGALVALARPSYRAPWLWPNHRRGTDYISLIWSFVALSIAFGTSIYLFRPRVVLVIAALIPALALLLTYLRLRGTRGVTAVIGMAALLVVTTVLVFTVIRGTHETDIYPHVFTVKAIILLALCSGVFLGRRKPAEDDDAREVLTRRLIMPGYSYVIGAAWLLVISAVLPAAALYKAAYKIEMESFVKHGQLDLVHNLEQHLLRLDAERVDQKRDPAVSNALKFSNLGVYYNFFFNTEVYHRPANVGSGDAFMAERSRMEMPLDMPNPVPRFVEWLLPQYSDHSIRMRELLHSQSADKRWRWRRRGGQLDFHSVSISGVTLVTVSEMPRLFPRYHSPKPGDLNLHTLVARDVPPDDPPRQDVAWVADPIATTTQGLLGFALAFAYVAFIAYGAYFVSRKVFLVDLRDPLWLDPKARVGPALGGNMLIFAPTVEAGLQVVDRRQFIHVSLADFDDAAGDVTEVWNRQLTRVDREPAGKGILITDFDRGTGNAAFMELKLRLLESAIQVHTRTVVAITRLSPWVLMDAVARQPELGARWKALLATFTVRIEDAAPAPLLDHPEQRIEAPAASGAVVLVKRAFHRMVNGSPEHAHALIDSETANGGAFLRQLGDDLRDRIRGREEIYDEIGERASMYYASLWATCTSAEKTVLSFIAGDGFANCKDRHTIRRLLARGLIRRDPNFKVMNETFRRFVIADAQKKEVAAYCLEEVPQSAWDKIQKPLMVGLVLGAGFFFFTQRELFDASFAVVTGVAGGIPAVLRLVGIFTAPREAIAAAR